MADTHPRITATLLADFARCDHRVFLDIHGDLTEKSAPTDHQQQLWADGRDHEARTRALFPHVTCPGETPEERREATLALMRAGEQRIYHGVLAHGDLIGEPDFLERVEIASDLGPHSYAPVEIKHGKAFTKRDGDTAKAEYLMQLCAYAELLHAAQGVRPERVLIIDDRFERQEFLLDEIIWQEYLRTRSAVERIVAAEEPTEPGWKAACGSCSWQTKCWSDLTARGDLTTVPGIGVDKRAVLYQIGIRSVSMLAEATPVQLTIKGISPRNRELWPRRAKALRDGTPELLARWEPPMSDLEVSYDVETCDGEVYLHGLLTRAAGGARWSPAADAACFGTFEPIYAAAGTTEEDAWRAFLGKLDSLAAGPSFSVYIYTPAEKTALRQLKTKYGGSEALTLFESRIVDLKKELCAAVLFPTSDQGLKVLASFVDFHWRDPDPGGAQSIAWWKTYLADPVNRADQRDRVLAYNEDDVRATFALLDWYRDFADRAPSDTVEAVQE